VGVLAGSGRPGPGPTSIMTSSQITLSQTESNQAGRPPDQTQPALGDRAHRLGSVVRRGAYVAVYYSPNSLILFMCGGVAVGWQ
jgi:hypothetical protein